MQRIRVASFVEIEEEFIERVGRMVWCNVATLDAQNRVRSRILHPIWEGTTGWIGTRRGSPKARHLVHNPHVSLAYIADIAKPIYADCIAEWADDERASSGFGIYSKRPRSRWATIRDLSSAAWITLTTVC